MNHTRQIHAQKHIALIAHDHRKADILNWVDENSDILSNHFLYATGTTGKLIEAKLSQHVECFLSGPLGGDQQIGAMIATGKIDMMIFFWDPMEMQPHDSDVRALLRIGAAWNIPMASDRATADFLISSPYMDREYTCDLPDFSGYLQRKLPE